MTVADPDPQGLVPPSYRRWRDLVVILCTMGALLATIGVLLAIAFAVGAA